MVSDVLSDLHEQMVRAVREIQTVQDEDPCLYDDPEIAATVAATVSAIMAVMLAVDQARVALDRLRPVE